MLASKLPFGFEYPVVAASRQQRWLWEQGVGVFDANNSLVAMESILLDITHRKQADEVLRKSESMFHTLVENAFNGICLLRNRGLEYVNQHFADIVGYSFDISSRVVKFCNSYHNVEGLRFVAGVAEMPPFANESFDVVVNVESARCYKSIRKFFAEVNRMLRPGGHFCFADMIKKGEVESIRRDLLSSGMEIVSETEITKNGVKALDCDHEHRELAIVKEVPSFLRKSFLQFAGAKGSERYESFASGKMEYWHFVLRKK